jgi:hypothetical protein
MTAKPAYHVTCGNDTKAGCGKQARIAFDRELPTKCGRCGNTHLKIKRLFTNDQQAELGL